MFKWTVQRSSEHSAVDGFAALITVSVSHGMKNSGSFKLSFQIFFWFPFALCPICR